jgi:hypothetical protein
MTNVIVYLRWLLAWASLAFLCGIGFLLALVNGLLGDYKRADRTFRSMSRLAASVIGYSGKYSLSAECGSRGNFGLYLIDKILGEGHCDQARREERLK